jgi:hypothetical protein
MAIDSGVLDYLWTKTVNIITYLTYRNPSGSNNGLFPEHVYTKVLPNLKHLRVFGYLVYVHVGKKQEGKMGSKFIRCIFTGYDEVSKAYHCYNSETRKMIISKDVVLNKDVMRVEFLQQKQRKKCA